MKGSMKKLIVPLLAGAAALTMATGVAQAQQKKTIALVTNVAPDFWTIAGRGLEKAQKEHPEYNIELIVTKEGTAAGQRRGVRRPIGAVGARRSHPRVRATATCSNTHQVRRND